MLALNKTKAALQGRLSHFSNIAENNTTLIDQVNARRFAHIFSNYGKSPGVTAAMARFPTVLQICNSLLAGGMRHWRTPLSSKLSGGNQSAKNSADTWLAEKPADRKRWLGFEPQIPTKGISSLEENHRLMGQSFEPIPRFFSHAGRNKSCSLCPQIGSEEEQDLTPKATITITIRPKIIFFISYPFGSSLACLRWRRLISPFTAVTINCAFVSPSTRLLSKSATTSCGKRALSCCDLLLVEPVAITESPRDRCDSVYANKRIIKDLKCDSLGSNFKNEGAIHLVSAKPGSARTLTGPLTKPLIEVTVMAGSQHTQTHPEFTWRFLAVSESHPQARAIVVYTNAPNEAEARSQIQGCILYFAARLPVHHFDLLQEVRHV